jgi:hypothetical protein
MSGFSYEEENLSEFVPELARSSFRKGRIEKIQEKVQLNTVAVPLRRRGVVKKAQME